MRTKEAKEGELTLWHGLFFVALVEVDNVLDAFDWTVFESFNESGYTDVFKFPI